MVISDLRLMAATESTVCLYFLKLNRKKWVRWGEGRKGHVLLSIFFLKNHQFYLRLKKRDLYLSKAALLCS